jgi:hypothetical protein
LLVDFGGVISRAFVGVEETASSSTGVAGASVMEVDKRVDLRRVTTCEEVLETDELCLLVLFLVETPTMSSNVCGGSEVTLSGERSRSSRLSQMLRLDVNGSKT